MGEAARIVRDGYDQMAERYLSWSREGAVRHRFLDEALVRLRPGSTVLDVGCGAGQPVAQSLALQHEVWGIDLSARQVELARAAVPTGRFDVADVTTVDVPAASLDAVLSFYALGHLPSAEHARFFRRASTWLKPGGFVLTSAPLAAGDEIVADWLGVPMYFGGIGEPATMDAVRSAGLEVEFTETVPEGEDEPGVSFLWIIARRH